MKLRPPNQKFLEMSNSPTTSERHPVEIAAFDSENSNLSVLVISLLDFYRIIVWQ